jgi:hypothetical protein
MSDKAPSSNSAVSCLVQVRPEPSGQFTAQLLGLPELHTTAATREEAVEQIRWLLRQQLDSGLLLSVDIPRENPLMSMFGFGKDAHDFEGYREEIRKFREEMDRQVEHGSDSGECSDICSTPIT